MITVKHKKSGILFVSEKLEKLYGTDVTPVTDPIYLMPDGAFIDSDKPMKKGQLVTYKTINDYVANGTNVVAIADIPKGQMIDGKGGFMKIEAPKPDYVALGAVVIRTLSEDHTVQATNKQLSNLVTRGIKAGKTTDYHELLTFVKNGLKKGRQK